MTEQKYVTFIIAVDVPEELVDTYRAHITHQHGAGSVRKKDEFLVEIWETAIQHQLDEDHGFHVIGTIVRKKDDRFLVEIWEEAIQHQPVVVLTFTQRTTSKKG